MTAVMLGFGGGGYKPNLSERTMVEDQSELGTHLMVVGTVELQSWAQLSVMKVSPKVLLGLKKLALKVILYLSPAGNTLRTLGDVFHVAADILHHRILIL